MNCKCGKQIIHTDDINWLDDLMACSDCYERTVDDSREVTPRGQND